MTVDIDEHIINSITFERIIEASENISYLIQKTPTIKISGFSKLFNHDVFFKLENLQKTGSFRVRGAANAIFNLKENNKLPEKIVSYNSGNHGLALACAGKSFGVKEVRLYLPGSIPKIKRELAEKYGAKIVITKTKEEAKKYAERDAKLLEYKLIAPSDNGDVISGVATAIYESLKEEQGFDGIFVPMIGEDLAIGAVLTKNYMSPMAKVYGGVPKDITNISGSDHKSNILEWFEEAFHAIADGTTLGITKKNSIQDKHLDGVYEISENEIKYWTTQFYRFTRNFCEPDSAMSLAAAHRWLEVQEDEGRKKILIIITGSNIPSSMQKTILHGEFLKCSSSN